MKNLIILFVLMVSISGCQKSVEKSGNTANSMNMGKYIHTITIATVVDSLINRYGEQNKFRIEKGTSQVAAFWMEQDGDQKNFNDFCLEYFVPQGEKLDTLFQKLERNAEILSGNFTNMSLQLREPLELDMGEITPIDMMMASYDPSSHLSDDFFKNKIAFYQLLNFPFYSLEAKLQNGSQWSRKEWAYARIADDIVDRVPAEVIQDYADISTRADAYISEYNIYMGNLTDSFQRKYFPSDLKLISHWGLRDELKSNYANPDGLTKQKMIYKVMQRIVTQEIPKEVINNNEYQWDPYANKLYRDGKEVSFAPENNIRYRYLLDLFKANKKLDQYNPYYSTAIERAFSQEMQIPEPDVEKLFIDLLSSAQVKKVANLISTRLERPLEPFDIWYNGFKPKNEAIDEKMLDAIVAKKYPTPDAFEADMPVILRKLGFNREEADYISSKITIDPSRGAGHALGAEMRTEKSHLRTRIGKNGMNYKGYNIAIHEFGHNVEQTLTLYDMDYYALKGIPNTAFTEALAFAFQKRDLELLGVTNPDPSEKYLTALDIFWSAYEIMGVSLVDVGTWKWLYEHPESNADELKQTVLNIAKDIWNKYYADIFGVQDQIILAVYSHMIVYPLYLSAYPVGNLIDYQIEENISGKNFATEVKRIFTSGNLTPDLWMKNAFGTGLSDKPLLHAVDEALTRITK